MLFENQVLSVGDNLPIKTDLPVHSGKVRSVYWLNKSDSKRLIKERQYNISEDSDLAIMVITDRISAFDCNWKAEKGLNGVPFKGAALNQISAYWFDLFKKNGLARSHILEVPHPLVWVVQKAKPVMIEAIARQYITGSMWRAYEKGERAFSGYNLPKGLIKNQLLSQLLITPSTKGILKGIPGIPEIDDCTIDRKDVEANYGAFNFHSKNDIALYEKLLKEGFYLISNSLKKVNQILVDTKFEFGYAADANGKQELIYMDEVGTPDSSRFWNKIDYNKSRIIEQSKESFRQQLLSFVPDKDVLLNSSRMQERIQLAKNTNLPASILLDLAKIYKNLAHEITGCEVTDFENPRESIINILKNEFNLIC